MIDVNIARKPKKKKTKDYPRLMVGYTMTLSESSQPIVLMLGKGKGIQIGGAFPCSYIVMNWDEHDFVDFTGTLELRNQ